MNKVLSGTILLAFAIVVPVSTMAAMDVNIGIGIGLPPPIVFEAPPAVIVIPDTRFVYAVPDIEVDLFFWNGWWWRLWEGRWYRSRYYNRGWTYYNRVPQFYFDVDPGWRGYYSEHNWYGHPWNYQPIPEQRLRQNWKTWQNNRYWERRGTWGVQRYQPRPQKQRQELRYQRQEQYSQRPEVQRHQQQMQEQRQRRQKEPQVREPQHPQQQHSQGQQRQGESQHQKSQGKPEQKHGEHKR